MAFEKPYYRADLKGFYHPYHSWRCTGLVYNDASSNLIILDETGFNPTLLSKTVTMSQKETSGTGGGATTANTVHTRTLNTIDGARIDHVNLAANQFLLLAGVHRLINGTATGHQVERHQAFIYDVDNSVYVIDGSGERATSVGGVETMSHLKGTIIIDVPTLFEFRHWAQAADPAGLGFAVDVHASNPQTTEVFGSLTFESSRR